MMAAEAFVSGSLGQAVFREDGALRILDAPKAEPRDALPNDIYWFRNAAREVAPVEPDGLPVAIAKVRSRLEEEVRFFNGLDGLLVGMDADFSNQTRKNAILRAELALSAHDDIARRIRERFLIPANTQEWNPKGGLALARENGAEAASDCYRPLAEGIIDRLDDDIAAVVLDKLGAGLDGARAREAILRSGLLAELAFIEMRGDRAALSAIVFHRGDFPKLQAVDPSGQILTALAHRIESRLPQQEESEPIRAASDPIITAVDRAKKNVVRRRGRQAGGGAGQVAGIQREIEWIGECLQEDEIERAEAALVELIDRQGAHGGRGHIIKTLTAVADLARKAKLFDWTWRVLGAIDRLGSPDAAVLCVRAETLRDLGRPEEALVAFAETMRRFPRNEVTRNAYAETLRELGRPEQALAAFAETMRRFPRNEVAPTAYAETLRELGRPEEALVAFAETMRRFPRNEVTRNAYAETLRELGRPEEALAAFEETMRRFPRNEVALTAYAETLRELGRPEEAFAAFEETMRRFPRNEVAPTAYAETLRDLGRPEEALVAFEDTMRRFPRNEVAPTAYAETLRELGRYDEALAVFEKTMDRFPRDEVAPTAYAETLRELGRPEEALVAFAETMRRFPRNEVAPTAHAETLRDLGRPEEALAAFEETMRRFPRDEVTRNAYAETLRELGRPEQALAAFEETMRRFPRNEVAPTAYAETLRDLGRPEEALVAFAETMRRFPRNEVTRNAYAETLRELGRPEQALAAFAETMRRFPRDAVAPNARAHLLAELGRFEEAEAALAPAAERLRTRGDWIAAHILAMARLRAGRMEEAIAALEFGAPSCPFASQRDYFATALPVALLAANRAEETAPKLKELAKQPMPRAEATNITLFQAHALAKTGDREHATQFLDNAHFIAFAIDLQKQLASALIERYGLAGTPPASGARARELDETITALEFELVRPRLIVFQSHKRRAA